MKRILLSVLVVFSYGHTAYGFNFPETMNLAPAPIYPDEFAINYNFEGIVALSNCSGSIIRFDESHERDQAVVLTNGHCIRMLKPGEVVLNQAANRTFDVLDRGAKRIGKVTAQSLIYATMTDTDLALYQLKETYQEIQDRFAITALLLSRYAPAIHTDIEVISGYWKRGYSCQIEYEVYNLKEGDWIMKDSLRYSRPGCEVIGGTSGSPVIDYRTREVIAVNNTINENGRKCTSNNPCEIDKDGRITYQKSYAYGQQTYWVYSCLDSMRKINMNLAGCRLPRPARLLSQIN